MKNRVHVLSTPNPLKEETNKKDKNIILEILGDYCKTSSLHGVGYLGAKDKSLAEKIWWIIMFLLSMTACCYLISNAWIKLNTSPVILSFEKTQVPLWEIPFPAVTVCPANKVQQSRYNYTEMFRKRDNITGEEYKKFWDISLVCRLERMEPDTDFNCKTNFTDESAVNFIRQFAPISNETIMQTYWQNTKENNLFFEQLTRDGLCFTFNSLSQDDMYTKQINNDIVYINHDLKNEGWSLENGYPSKLSMNTYPRRSARDGKIFGLTVELSAFVHELDYVCGLPISGYKIILHNPAETPKAGQHYFFVPLNRKMALIVRPDLTRTDKAVRSLSIDGRKCYFSDEKSLRFFKVYTQNNCRVECDANVTHYYCGCVPFYMPRDKNTLICGFAKMGCMKELQDIVLFLETNSDISYTKESVKLKQTSNIVNECRCLPACTSLEYTVEASQTEQHEIQSLLASGIYNKERIIAEELGSIKTTSVDIFFKDSQFLALQRSEIYGQTDFFASCGGLLGLFLGFSLISLLEIVYYFTFRLYFKFSSRRKN